MARFHFLSFLALTFLFRMDAYSTSVCARLSESVNEQIQARSPILDLDTDEKKFLFLLAVEKILPGYLRSGALFDYDPMALLDAAHAIEMKKNHIENFIPPKKTENLLSIQIEPLSEEAISVTSIDPFAFSKWQQELMEAAKTLSPERPAFEAVAERVKDAKARLKDMPTFFGFWTGLKRTLSPEQRSQIGNLPFEKQIAFLHQHLPEKLKERGFKTNLTIHEGESEKDVAIALAKFLHDEEENLAVWLQLYVLCEGREMPSSELPLFLSNLNSSQLHDLVDPQYLKIKLKDLKRLTDVAPSQATYFINPRMEKLHAERIQEKSEFLRPLILKEMPSWLSLFRNQLGRDCSSKYSGPICQSSREKVFLITDSSGDQKGYAQITILNQHSAQYLHTIQGGSLRASDAVTIAAGMRGAKKDLHVEDLILAQEKNAVGFIDRGDVRETYNSLATGQPTIQLAYDDGIFRTVLKENKWVHSDLLYDDPSKNQSGLKVTNAKLPPVRVDVKAAEWTLELPETFSKRELTLVILDRLMLDRDSGVERLASLGSTPFEKIKNAVATLRNESGLPVKEFLEAREKALRELEMEFTAEELRDRSFYLWMGLVRARDAFHGPNKEEAVRALIGLYKLNAQRGLERIISANAKILGVDARFQDYLSERIKKEGMGGWFSPLREMKMPIRDMEVYLSAAKKENAPLRISDVIIKIEEGVFSRGHRLSKLLFNDEELPVSEYKKRIEEEVNPLFYPEELNYNFGLLRCRDLSDEKNISSSIPEIIEIIFNFSDSSSSLKKSVSSLVHEFLKTNMDLLLANADFNHFYNNLPSEKSRSIDALYILKEFADAGIAMPNSFWASLPTFLKSGIDVEVTLYILKKTECGRREIIRNSISLLEKPELPFNVRSNLTTASLKIAESLPVDEVENIYTALLKHQQIGPMREVCNVIVRRKLGFEKILQALRNKIGLRTDDSWKEWELLAMETLSRLGDRSAEAIELYRSFAYAIPKTKDDLFREIYGRAALARLGIDREAHLAKLRELAKSDNWKAIEFLGQLQDHSKETRDILLKGALGGNTTPLRALIRLDEKSPEFQDLLYQNILEAGDEVILSIQAVGALQLNSSRFVDVLTEIRDGKREKPDGNRNETLKKAADQALRELSNPSKTLDEIDPVRRIQRFDPIDPVLWAL